MVEFLVKTDPNMKPDEIRIKQVPDLRGYATHHHDCKSRYIFLSRDGDYLFEACTCGMDESLEAHDLILEQSETRRVFIDGLRQTISELQEEVVDLRKMRVRVQKVLDHFDHTWTEEMVRKLREAIEPVEDDGSEG